MFINHHCFLISSIVVFSVSGCHLKPSKEEQRQELDSLLSKEVKIPVVFTGNVMVSTKDVPFDDGKMVGTNTTETRRITAELERFVAFDPNANGLYPGSLVQGKGLKDGLLLPVTTDRNPITITISDFYQKGNLSLSRTVKNPSLATVNDAFHAILKQGFNTEQSSKVSFSAQRVYSMEQAFFDLNASYKWATGSIGTGFTTTKDQTYSKYLVRFVEKYFTVSCEAPASPVAFISPSANYEDLKQYISNDASNPNPLCYVSSVTYGRELWLLVESSEQADTLEAVLNASFSGVSAGATLNVKDRNRKILQESTIQSFIMGGGKKAALNYLSGDKIAGIGDFIKAGGTLLESDLPQPISYQVSYLSDNTPARVSSTTDYEINTSNHTNKPQPLVSATIHFDNGNDGKDQNTGLRILLFDSKTVGSDLNSNIENLMGNAVARLDFLNNNQQGVEFANNSSLDFPMGIKNATTDQLLKNGVLVVWCFIQGHDTWEFTPTVHLHFQDGSSKDIIIGGTTLSQNNGIGFYPFTLK